MTDWYFALPATIVLIALSAFFVMIEFALLGAQRHRLEATVQTSASSRAALRSLNDLTLMLAGAQLGITVCTFALGAVTKPWVHHMLMPLFESLSLPLAVADGISFVLALFIVTFLHLVVGEMAPKSWAIAHPESAVRLIAIPARVFITIFRPLLVWINHMANALVRRAGENPVNRAAAKGYDAQTLAHLVHSSHTSGALESHEAHQLSELLDFEFRTAAEVLDEPQNKLPQLPATASVAEAQHLAVNSQQLRILITESRNQIPRLLNVRDTLQSADHQQVATYAWELLRVEDSKTLLEVLKEMRAEKVQVVAVVNSQGDYLGLLTWEYLVHKLWQNSTREQPAQI
ncbi:MAG: hemolysin family protein [Rothia sp. (in: high G+C Gram-positive bacteria)]|nr:hemolysin family protein [Rothia sp. (in: high G+C Gram-positive bacteria)]